MASHARHYSSHLTGDASTPQDEKNVYLRRCSSATLTDSSPSVPQKLEVHRNATLQNVGNSGRQPGLDRLSPAIGLTIADIIEAFDHALSVEELAPLLGLSESNLYSKAREGRIPSYRIFGSIRFDPQKTAEWLRHQFIAVA